jgi:hypothetical protein
MQKNTIKIKRKGQRPPQALAKKRKERQATRTFIYNNREKFDTPKVAIKRVLADLSEWDQIPLSQGEWR